MLRSCCRRQEQAHILFLGFVIEVSPRNTSRRFSNPVCGTGLTMMKAAKSGECRLHLLAILLTAPLQGFYSLFRNIFNRLALEESCHGSEIEFPTFGYSTWTWTSVDESNTSVKHFYSAWTNFVTAKSFTWLDKAPDATDRRTRRYIERDNQKARENAKREYAETVRDLAKYVRKRDPRYQQFHKDSKHVPQTPRKVTSKKPGAEHQVYVEQDWQKLAPAEEEDTMDWAYAEGPALEWECVACLKTFKSEASWDSHERSKKHLKAVEMLKQEMATDDLILGLQGKSAVESHHDEGKSGHSLPIL
jgi:DnaJ family protein A protein 5